jgi:hypothetical protein
MDATATVSVEQAADPGATWVEEVIAYSLCKGPLARWGQRWLLDPLLRGRGENEPRIARIYTDQKRSSFPSVFIREIRG